MTEIKKNGLYEHYKGKKYRVLDIVYHSETLEKMVLYQTLYENEISDLWVRPYGMFLESVLINGKSQPRFKLVD